MTTTTDSDPAASLIEPPISTAVAISYLRVSTREQASKGGTDEGFSIPAQREAVRRKADQNASPSTATGSNTNKTGSCKPTTPTPYLCRY